MTGTKVIVVSLTSKYVRAKEACVGKGFCDTLDTTVKAMLDKAVERAKANGRKTVRAQDLI